MIIEVHSGGLMRHFGVTKTLDILHEYIFLAEYEERCRTNYVEIVIHVEKLNL